MNGSDYIAILIRNLSGSKTDPKAGSARKLVATRDELEQYVVTSIGDSYTRMGDDIEVAIEKLNFFGAAVPMFTPHAKTRYIIEYKWQHWQSNTWPFKDGVAEVAKIYADLGDGWLRESIIGAGASESGSDGDLSAVPAARWSPLPLDRPDEQLEKVVESLEGLIEQVRSDNGYAVEHPAERADVLSRLRGATDYLSNAATITATAIDIHLLWPLRRLVIRFGPSAIGTVAKFAWSLFSEWLKKKLEL